MDFHDPVAQLSVATSDTKLLSVFRGRAVLDGRECRISIDYKLGGRFLLTARADSFGDAATPPTSRSPWLLELTYGHHHQGDLLLERGRQERESVDGWFPGNQWLGDVRAPVVKATAYLLNGVGMEGDEMLGWTQPSSAGGWTGRTMATASDISVVLDAIPGLHLIEEGLWSSGNYSITHAIRFSSKTGQPLTHERVSEVATALHMAISFMLGRFSAPVNLTGLESDGTPRWAELGTRHVDRHEHVITWWDQALPQRVDAALQPLLSALLNPDKRESLLFLIQSYVASNRGGFVEQRIITAYAALEHLAWIRLVIEGQRDFNKVNREKSDWRIRRLLEVSGVPGDIGAMLEDLDEYARQRGIDGPGAAASVRDSITHPNRARASEQDSPPYSDVWLLLQRWLSLTILSWCGYDGLAADQRVRGRWSGEGDPVPWSAPGR